MKQIFTLFSILIIQLTAVAQQTNNLIIFAEDATPFYVILNGIKQNIEPQTNVKIEGIASQQNQVKVIFKNTSIPALNKQWYSEEMNIEATMKIANTKKGYKLRYFGQNSMGAAPVDPAQNVIVYHTTEIVEATPVVVEPTVETTTTVVTQETTAIGTPGTQTEINENAENIDVNMNVGGFNLNMGVNVTETNGGGVQTSTSQSGVVTSSTTTTTTTTTGGGRIDNGSAQYIEPVQPIVYVEGYTGSVGCSVPSNSMASIKSAIDNESFSDDKMMVAKQATNNKCLTTIQVMELMEMFDFEDSKLAFAKYAYSKTYDVDNYYQVNSLFDFSSSKTELNEYIAK
ncbi:MAG: hypothetical protein ACI9EV_002867 [Urechidicola sp.]|jgi:hypothetical protein